MGKGGGREDGSGWRLGEVWDWECGKVGEGSAERVRRKREEHWEGRLRVGEGWG